MGMDLSMLGARSDTGRVRAMAKKEVLYYLYKLFLTKIFCVLKVKHNVNKKQKLGPSRLSTSSGATNGMSSSLVFTPVQGMELVNPQQQQMQADKLKEVNKKWFEASSGFLSAAPKNK